MRNLTCIVCPIGCSLEITGSADANIDDLRVTGNRCPRGEIYAREEIFSPKRIVTATCAATCAAVCAATCADVCKTNGETSGVRRVPVKTVSPCPREKIPALLDDIYKTKVALPVKTGDIVISNWNGEGIDVAATRSL